MRPASLWIVLPLAWLSGACREASSQEHAGHGATAVPAMGDLKAPAPPASTATPAVDPHARHAGHAAGHAGHTGHGEAAASAKPPAGFAPVMIPPERAAALNLTTALVEERELAKPIRTVGVVTVDETRTSHVHAKVRGFIEGIRASFLGQKIKRGEALCSLYSQEVFGAELEFLAMLDQTSARGAPSGAYADIERNAQAQILGAARKRLALWDVPPAEIARLERTREARRTFTLSAPRGGIVVAKNALEGTFVDPSVELYVISDLSRVWVQVDLYESDLPFVHVGDVARLTIGGHDGTLEAPATFLAPTLDEATRTLKVRFELDNKDAHLRPGTFATAEMDLSLGRGLAVPESAVIRTGQRAIAFVVKDQMIQPRELDLGPSVGGMYRVNAGLTAGELVATGAQFLIDSESRLRATGPSGAGHVH